MRQLPERDVQNAIRAYLGSRGVACFRCNVGRVRTADGRFFDTGLPEGFPDLIALPGNGRIVFVEVKTLTGRLREAQKRFREWATAHGYEYIVARSVADVEGIAVAER